ncbi:hypothetical protein [Rhodovulum sulfidophilum]|nr:hypothetical protein [Rhodovulum sulfidophilum]MCE8457985.1 hypothetical protein [Rhodovulum sulfidophilum]
MSEVYQNNYITGTWFTGQAGLGVLSGDFTTFNGTITETGETFTALYYGAGINLSPLPGSAGGGAFTFNGTLEDFLGWSFGVTASAGINASYSTNTSLHSLITYGASSTLDIGITTGYTKLVDELDLRPYESTDFWRSAISAVESSDIDDSQKSDLLDKLVMARDLPAWREGTYDEFDFGYQQDTMDFEFVAQS